MAVYLAECRYDPRVQGVIPLVVRERETHGQEGGALF